MHFIVTENMLGFICLNNALKFEKAIKHIYPSNNLNDISLVYTNRDIEIVT